MLIALILTAHRIAQTTIRYRWRRRDQFNLRLTDFNLYRQYGSRLTYRTERAQMYCVVLGRILACITILACVDRCVAFVAAGERGAYATKLYILAYLAQTYIDILV